MNPVFLETSTINFFVNHGYDGAQVYSMLGKNNFYPLIGKRTFLELANDGENRKKLFQFVRGLTSLFVCHREWLYLREEDKLKRGVPVIFCVSPIEHEIINQKIEELCSGEYNDHDETAINSRNSHIEEVRNTIWTSAKDPEKIKILKGKNFEEFLLWFLKEAKSNLKYLDYLSAVFKNLTRINVDRHLLGKFIDNIKEYPALRTSLYSNLYLDFIAQKNPDQISKDKIPDSLQLIEGSYSAIFVSNDKWHLNSGNNINPYLKILKPEDLILL